MQGNVKFKPTKSFLYTSAYSGEESITLKLFNPKENHNLCDCESVDIVFNDENVILIDDIISDLEETRRKIVTKSHTFKIPIENIIVPEKFKKFNPDYKKILDVQYYGNGFFNKEISVDKNLIIRDGYTAYLVAKYRNVRQIAVVCEDGINTKNYGYVTSPKIEILIIDISCDDEDTVFKLYINEEHQGLFYSMEEMASAILDIYKIFSPELHFKDNKYKTEIMNIINKKLPKYNDWEEF